MGLKRLIRNFLEIDNSELLVRDGDGAKYCPNCGKYNTSGELMSSKNKCAQCKKKLK